MERRTFNAGLMGLALAGAAAPAWSAARRTRGWLAYAGMGPALYGYGVDPRVRSLASRQGPVALPQIVQCVWQNPRTGHLYVGASEGIDGQHHSLHAFAVGPDGGLSPVGPAVTLPARPIHMTVDHRGDYVLLAFPRPSSVAVHRLAADGSLAGEVSQTARLDTGVYPHEIRVMPSNRAVMVMSRGIAPTPRVEAQPGGVRIFSFNGGQLANIQTVAPNGGMGFNPRNTEFHPSGRWAYVALEAQNQVRTYALSGDRLGETPLFTATTLLHPEATKPGQMLSVGRIHPSGRFLYIVNRATGSETFQGQQVVVGEESLAVFAIDGRTGEPRLVQSVELASAGSRGLSLSPDGRWLVAAGLSPARVRVGDRVETVPQQLSLYAIGADGRLTLAGRTAAPSPEQATVWAGTVVY